MADNYWDQMLQNCMPTNMKLEPEIRAFHGMTPLKADGTGSSTQPKSPKYNGSLICAMASLFQGDTDLYARLNGSKIVYRAVVTEPHRHEEVESMIVWDGNICTEGSWNVEVYSGSVVAVPNQYAGALIGAVILKDKTLLQEWQSAWRECVEEEGVNIAEADWTQFADIWHKAYELIKFTNPTGSPSKMADADKVPVWTHGNLNRSGPKMFTHTAFGGTSHVGGTAPWEKLSIRKLVPVQADESSAVVDTKSAVPSEDTVTGPYIGKEGAILEMCMKAGKHCLLDGPPGTGKTILTKHLLESMFKDFIMFTGSTSTTDLDLLGVNSMNSSGKIVWHNGPLTEAMLKGIPLYVDELNRMPTKMQNILLGAMAGAMTVTLHDKDGSQVTAKDGFFVITSVNLEPNQATEDIDPAVRDRFERTIHFKYPTSVKREANIVSMNLPNCDMAVIQTITRIIQAARQVAGNGGLHSIPTIRDNIKWNEFHQQLGGNLSESAEYTVTSSICGYQDDGEFDETNLAAFMAIIEDNGGK